MCCKDNGTGTLCEVIVIVNMRNILIILLLIQRRGEPSGVQVSILSPASHNGSLLPAEPAPNLHSNNPNLRPPSSAAPKKHPKCGAIFSIHASLLFFRCQQRCFVGLQFCFRVTFVPGFGRNFVVKWLLCNSKSSCKCRG